MGSCRRPLGEASRRVDHTSTLLLASSRGVIWRSLSLSYPLPDFCPPPFAFPPLFVCLVCSEGIQFPWVSVAGIIMSAGKHEDVPDGLVLLEELSA